MVSCASSVAWLVTLSKFLALLLLLVCLPELWSVLASDLGHLCILYILLASCAPSQALCSPRTCPRSWALYFVIS